MKQLNQYIIEKFKINSKTIHKSQEIENKFGNKTLFNKEEIEEINEYCNDLPIIPDIITNYNHVSPKLPNGHGGSYSSDFINLVYYVKDFKVPTLNNDGQTNNTIMIKKHTNKGTTGYIVRIIKTKDETKYVYPETNIFFKSIKECFDCIIKHWVAINFSEVIKEYK